MVQTHMELSQAKRGMKIYEKQVAPPFEGWLQMAPPSGNPRLLIGLDPVLHSGLQAQALSRGVGVNDLVRFLLVEYVKQAAEEREGAPAILRDLDRLIRTLQLQVNALTLQALPEGAEATKQPLMAVKDTQQERLDLHDTVDAILKAVVNLCESKEAAKARMAAVRLANDTIRTDLMVLEGFDSRDIQALLDEVRETNERLKAQLAASQKGTEEASKPAGS